MTNTGAERARAGDTTAPPPTVNSPLCPRHRYVSIIPAAIARYEKTKAPPPPSELMDLLWPEAIDREAPWITELGWTCVPPDQDPQEMHADICTSQDNAPFTRQDGQGRSVR